MLVFASCKSKESAYKQAYEKAKAQENTQVQVNAPMEVTPVAATPAGSVSYDQTPVRQEQVSVVSVSGTLRPLIINNTGLSARGELGHIELDSVTFERGKPEPINLEGAPKYVASEMCQIFGDHWGYASLDYNFKSLADIIKDYCTCRRYGSNLLLNVGPMGDGKLRLLDTAMLRTLGDWIRSFSEATAGTLPTGVEVDGRDGDFLMKGEGAYYLFCHDLAMRGAADVVVNDDEREDFTVRFKLAERVKSMSWLENGGKVSFVQDGDELTVYTEPQPYGQSVVVRIVKIEV